MPGVTCPKLALFFTAYSEMAREIRVSLVTQIAKNLPVIQETQVSSLGWEDPLRIEWLPTPWRIPWTEEPSGLQSMGWQRVRHYYYYY